MQRLICVVPSKLISASDRQAGRLPTHHNCYNIGRRLLRSVRPINERHMQFSLLYLSFSSLLDSCGQTSGGTPESLRVLSFRNSLPFSTIAFSLLFLGLCSRLTCMMRFLLFLAFCHYDFDQNCQKSNLPSSRALANDHISLFNRPTPLIWPRRMSRR